MTPYIPAQRATMRKPRYLEAALYKYSISPHSTTMTQLCHLLHLITWSRLLLLKQAITAHSQASQNKPLDLHIIATSLLKDLQPFLFLLLPRSSTGFHVFKSINKSIIMSSFMQINTPSDADAGGTYHNSEVYIRPREQPIR